MSDFRFKNGSKRVWHYHCMKTGGTTINHAFYEIAKRHGKDSTKWNTSGMRSPHIVFGHSHSHAGGVKLPEGTFTITCLRDPYARLISRYRHMRYLARKKNGLTHYNLQGVYGDILEKGFQYFLKRAPATEVQHQLFMFGGMTDPMHAVKMVDKKVDFILFQENLTEDMNNLMSLLGEEPIELGNLKKFKNVTFELTQEDIRLARKAVRKETEFVDKVRRKLYRKQNEALIISDGV